MNSDSALTLYEHLEETVTDAKTCQSRKKIASKVSAWLSMGCMYSRFHLPSATHLQNFVLQSGAFHLPWSGYITLIITKTTAFSPMLCFSVIVWYMVRMQVSGYLRKNVLIQLFCCIWTYEPLQPICRWFFFFFLLLFSSHQHDSIVQSAIPPRCKVEFLLQYQKDPPHWFYSVTFSVSTLCPVFGPCWTAFCLLKARVSASLQITAIMWQITLQMLSSADNDRPDGGMPSTEASRGLDKPKETAVAWLSTLHLPGTFGPTTYFTC